MPEKVELIFVAETDQYVNNVKNAQKASQELHNTVEKNNKREKGLIEDIEDELVRLAEARKKAWKIEDIEKYNQKIAEAKKDLQEYEKAGVKVEKTTQSLSSSITKWALSLGGVAVAIKVLKDAIMQLTVGIDAANIVGATFKQIMNDIVTGQGINISNIKNAISVQKQLNQMRLEESVSTYKAAVFQRDYNKFYFEASDRRKTDEERILSLNKALEAHNKMINEEINTVEKQIDANEKLRKTQGGSEKLTQEYIALNTKLIQLDARRYSETKRVEALRTGLLSEQQDKRAKLWEDYFEGIKKSDEDAQKERLRIQKEYQDLSDKLLKEWDQSQIDIFEGADKLKAQRNFAIKQIKQLRDQMELVGTITDEQMKMLQGMVDNVWKAYYKAMADEANRATPEQREAISKSLLSGLPDLPGLQKSYIRTLEDVSPLDRMEEVSVWKLLGLDADTDEGKAQIDAIKETAKTITDILEDTLDHRVDMAERERELLDTKISELQREIDTEAELHMEGYANNLTLKQQELEELKKQREKALAEEEAAIKKQQQLERVLQTASLASSVANILKSFTSLGPAGLAMASVAIAGLWALWSASKAKAAESTKLAHGGVGDSTGMVKGRLHSEGGERFLDHIEVERGEKWGVLSRQASHKFGDAFDYMISSFNKGEMPMFAPPAFNNAVTVENSGPNSRLDKVIKEQQKLNANFGRSSQYLTVGTKRIIRNGNKVRIIG